MKRNPKTIWLWFNWLVLYFGIADSLILRFEIVSKTRRKEYRSQKSESRIKEENSCFSSDYGLPNYVETTDHELRATD